MILFQGENATVDNLARVRNSKVLDHARVKHYSELIDSTLGEYSYVSQYSIVNKTIIGKYCSIANSVSIGLWQHDTEVTTHTFHLYETSGHFVQGYRNFKLDNVTTYIGNDVWVGANSVIMKGVRVGDGAIIGAGAVVTKDVPAYGIVIGQPAKLHKFRFDEETIAFLEKVQWWNNDRNEIKKMIEAGCFNDMETFKKYYQSDTGR